MLERVQFFLELANQEIGQVVAASCIAPGFQVGNGADPIAAGIERSEAAIEPRRVDLLRLDLGDDVPLREVESPGDELGEAVRIDYGDRVEVLTGLDAADEVIINPSDSLVSGAAVRLVNHMAGGAA